MTGHRSALAMLTVVGITGASGIIYGVRLLQSLPGKKTVIVSREAEKLARAELGMRLRDLHALADAHFDNEDLFCPLASGSVRFDSLVIAPCSTSTMSKIACGIADNLVTRIASVALKEHRRLILLLRETPLSSIHLANMRRLAEAGAVIMPASPAFYPKPETVQDMVDFIVGRILDELGIENNLYTRWSGATKPPRYSRGSRRNPGRSP